MSFEATGVHIVGKLAFLVFKIRYTVLIDLTFWRVRRDSIFQGRTNLRRRGSEATHGDKARTVQRDAAEEAASSVLQAYPNVASQQVDAANYERCIRPLRREGR